MFNSQEYLKTAVPSQLAAERGSHLVVINPGSANIRIGLAQHDTPLNIPHCIARHVRGPKKNVQDQMLNSQITTAQHMEREKAYDNIASLLKIPFLDEEVANNSFSRKMARLDGYNPQNSRKDVAFEWTNVYEQNLNPDVASVEHIEAMHLENSTSRDVSSESREQQEDKDPGSKYREFMCGDEALRISPTEPYCLRRPIRRGHLNISQYYPMQQVIEDLYAIWDWILVEKLNIPHSQRNMYAAILVLPETLDNREIKELLSIVLRDLRFNSAVVHQEAIAAVFGNGLSTACIVNIGAQVTTVICIEDGVALPTTAKTLPFGGEDISRCLLWTQRHHQTWPPIRTDSLTKPMDLLMLNNLKESYCQIKEGELDMLAVVHSYEDGVPVGSHKTRLTALNVPPMGLFYPALLVPEVYPPPPLSWFSDYDDMLEDTWTMEFPRRSETDNYNFISGYNAGLPWESYPFFSSKPKREEKVGLAEAITSSILLTGRIDLKRKLFCSIQLIGGVALTGGLISAVEDRVLHTIPSNEAIDTVEFWTCSHAILTDGIMMLSLPIVRGFQQVLQSRTHQSLVPWKGGAIIGILDFGREGWIHREDWIRNGVHVGLRRKYSDSYYLQAQAMCYINS